MGKDIEKHLVQALNSAIRDAAQRHPDPERFRKPGEFVHPPCKAPDAEPELNAEEAIVLYDAKAV